MDKQDGEQQTTYKYHRRSTRLRGHDYTWTRAYFVTARAQTHDPIFEILALHQILEETWYALPNSAKIYNGGSFWLSRFHDEVIDSQDALERIRFYIHNNPAMLDNREG